MEQHQLATPHDPLHYKDPVIEACKKNVDLTMLRENLKLSVQERVDHFIAFMKAREECARRRGGAGGAEMTDFKGLIERLTTEGWSLLSSVNSPAGYMELRDRLRILCGIAGTARCA